MPPFDFPLLLINRRRIWTLYRTFYLLLPRSLCHLFFLFRGVLSYLHRKLNLILWLLSRPVISFFVCFPSSVDRGQWLSRIKTLYSSQELSHVRQRHISICNSVIENQVQEIFPTKSDLAARTT